MKVNIVGRTSKKLSKELTEAANFFADILLSPRIKRNLDITIKIYKKLDSCGYCEVVDHKKNPRKFIIEILNDGVENPICVLAHEMVHLKQYARNELGDEVIVAKGNTSKEFTQWKGELWKPKGKDDPYFDSPWEIEAHGREVGLIYRWKRRKLNKKQAK